MVKQMKYLIGIHPSVDSSIREPLFGFLVDEHMDFACHVGYPSCISDIFNKNKDIFIKYVYITNDVKSALDFFITNDIIDAREKTTEKLFKELKWIINNFGMESRMTENTWFTSDSHFHHRNIVKYCNRPWNEGKDDSGEIIVTDENVAIMNEEMIKRWNSVVGKNDIVWHLGDFCLGKDQDKNIPELVSRLNGKINLVLGNHDHHSVRKYYEWGFNRVYDRKVIINDYVILSHAPVEFIGPNSCWFNVFGHVHNSSNYQTFTKSSCCVCVERHDYKPISWKTIEEQYNMFNKEN